MRAAILASCVLFLVPCPAGAEEIAALEELEQRIGEVLEETGTPGIGLAIVNRDEVLWAGGIGVANRATGEAVTADTVFRIGSITKTFVALAALMLVEEGKLDLEAPLRDLLPDVEFENPWEETDPVRVVHLLEHTTGWDDVAPRDYAHNVEPPITLREGIDLNPGSRRSRWRPGTSMAYCNSGPPIVAYLIQTITGRDFEDFVRERLFDPLGMTFADFQRPPEIAERLASGYNGDDPVDYWNLMMRPAGSINTSAREMTGFVQLLLNRGRAGDTVLLQPDAIDRMEISHTTRAARAGLRAGYGLHNDMSITDGFVYHGHNGRMNGYLAEMAYLPDHGRGYAIMINAANGRALREIRDLVRAFLTQDLEPVPSPPAATVDAASLRSRRGWYEPITPRIERIRFADRLFGLLRVEVRGRSLEIEPLFGESETLVAVSDRLFRREDDPIASVVFYDGEDERIMLESTGTELQRVSPLVVWSQLLLGPLSIVLMLSTLPFALIWIPRRLFGKLKDAPHMSVRVLPLLAAASFAGAIVVLFSSFADPIETLGKRSIRSLGFCLLTWSFAIASVLGLVQAVRHRAAAIHPGVRIHSMLASLGATTVMLYLLYWGVIGWRTWA